MLCQMHSHLRLHSAKYELSSSPIHPKQCKYWSLMRLAKNHRPQYIKSVCDYTNLQRIKVCKRYKRTFQGEIGGFMSQLVLIHMFLYSISSNSCNFRFPAIFTSMRLWLINHLRTKYICEISSVYLHHRIV